MKVLLMLILLAVAIYFIVRALDTRGIDPRASLPRPKARQRPVAPDDDEDFLSSLNRRDPGDSGSSGPPSR